MYCSLFTRPPLQDAYYQSVETRLNNNLSNSEKENYNNLNNTAQIVDQKGKKIEEKYNNTVDSTLVRSGGEIANNINNTRAPDIQTQKEPK